MGGYIALPSPRWAAGQLGWKPYGGLGAPPRLRRRARDLDAEELRSHAAVPLGGGSRAAFNLGIFAFASTQNAFHSRPWRWVSSFSLSEIL